MSDVILKVENVSKLYRLGTVGTGTFGGDVQRFWKTKIMGQEDPFLKIGQTNDRTSKEKVEFVWALKDINFEINSGEVVGIIGNNGAGKSTLLKLLSRITSPTTGTIKAAGRMASLLEVGTGFHPELTGRENVFLNGAILGMTKKEIQSKFDEIVDFSGCELYIDTPTKRYSSGMTVRLGFAVAAFLEPEILVVDEILAVGDAEFQKKAIGKMKNVSTEQGRTVLFVSHSMNAIKHLTSKSLVMSRGEIAFFGQTNDAINFYLNNSLDQNSLGSLLNLNNVSNDYGKVRISRLLINQNNSYSIEIINKLELLIELFSEIESQINFEIKLVDSDDQCIYCHSPLHLYNKLLKIKKGNNNYEVKIQLPIELTQMKLKLKLSIFNSLNENLITYNDVGYLFIMGRSLANGRVYEKSATFMISG
jgi:lipopolysaccharide transport system ATP-binding protein